MELDSAALRTSRMALDEAVVDVAGLESEGNLVSCVDDR